jgi:hypothetical protein
MEIIKHYPAKMLNSLSQDIGKMVLDKELEADDLALFYFDDYAILSYTFWIYSDDEKQLANIVVIYDGFSSEEEQAKERFEYVLDEFNYFSNKSTEDMVNILPEIFSSLKETFFEVSVESVVTLSIEDIEERKSQSEIDEERLFSLKKDLWETEKKDAKRSKEDKEDLDMEDKGDIVEVQ